MCHYSYDDFGDVVPDQSAKGHNGEINGHITLEAEGMHKGAAKFVTQSVLDLDGPGSPDEDIPTTAITLAAWAKCENTGGDRDNPTTGGAGSANSMQIVEVELIGVLAP